MSIPFLTLPSCADSTRKLTNEERLDLIRERAGANKAEWNTREETERPDSQRAPEKVSKDKTQNEARPAEETRPMRAPEKKIPPKKQRRIEQKRRFADQQKKQRKAASAAY